MKIAMGLLLWTSTMREEHLPLLDTLAEMGFDGVEIPVVLSAESMLEKTAKRCDALGLGRTAVGYATKEANPASPDPAVRAAAVQHLSTLARKTALLGADLVGGPIHSAYAEFTGSAPTESERAWSAEVLRASGEAAQAHGVRLGVEYLNRFECYLVNSAEDTDALVRRVDHPAVCTVFDTHHSHIEDDDCGDAIRRCQKTLGHVQVSESHRGLLGTGQVHWNRAFDALREIDYGGWLAIESFSRHDPEFAAGLHVWRDPADDLMRIPREGLAFLRRKLAGE